MSIVDSKGLGYYDKKSQARNGYWEAQENVKDGDIRKLAGKDGTGFVLECIVAGETGDVQPSIPLEYYESEYAISYEELSDYIKETNKCLATADDSIKRSYDAIEIAKVAVTKCEEILANFDELMAKAIEKSEEFDKKIEEADEKLTYIDNKYEEYTQNVDNKYNETTENLNNTYIDFGNKVDIKINELQEQLDKGYQLKAIRVTEEDIDEMFRTMGISYPEYGYGGFVEALTKNEIDNISTGGFQP